MSARSIWNGTLTFGAVAIPIKLFTATERRGLSFKEVRRADGARIAHRRVGAESGEEIAYADVEKGYDGDGRGLVVLTKEEIAAAEGPSPKVVAIEHFVKAEEIDPVYYDKPYHLGAGKGGAHAYRVLLAALEQSRRVGIGRFVLRSREQLVAVRPIDGALGMQTMRFADELRDPDDLELPSLRKKPKDREVQMAERLVEMMVVDWEPESHEDTYRAAVMDLVERKRTGKRPKRARKRKDAGDDLADALEASLAGFEKGGSGAKGAGAKRASGGTAAKGTGGGSGAKGAGSKGPGAGGSGSKGAGGGAKRARSTGTARETPKPGTGKQPSASERARRTKAKGS